MTDKTKQEAFTVEEIEAVYKVAFALREGELLYRLRANRKPKPKSKARPAFVGDDVLVDGIRERISDVSTSGEFVWFDGGTCWEPTKTLIHLDGTPVSKAYPPIPDPVHRSQLKMLDELEDDRHYTRYMGDGGPRGEAMGSWYKAGPAFSTSLFYPLPTVEGDDDA